MCPCEFICPMCMQCLWRPEEGTGSPATLVTECVSPLVCVIAMAPWSSARSVRAPTPLTHLLSYNRQTLCVREVHSQGQRPLSSFLFPSFPAFLSFLSYVDPDILEFTIHQIGIKFRVILLLLLLA